MVNKNEQKARNVALIILGVMVVIWTIFGIWSFTDRGDYERPQTTKISFDNQTALRGKQVFQAYNCMDCHTIVGNGAYFAPDLTHIYDKTGPAWLMAYLGSPGTYPTKAIVNIQLQQLYKKGEVETDNIDTYYSKFQYAEERVEERGGIDALMPNLKFTKDEINALIAFFKYTGKINTAGWPPKVVAKKSIIEKTKRELEAKSGIFRNQEVAATAIVGTGNSSEGENSLLSGKKTAKNLGCTACHSADGSVRVGPTWKGLYESPVELADGKTVQADIDYLKRSILKPDTEIVKGYPEKVMPPYEGNLSEDDLHNIIEYIKSVK